MTPEEREKLIERLIDNAVENVTQFALQDPASLREYVSQAEAFDKLDDDTLENLHENAFGGQPE